VWPVSVNSDECDRCAARAAGAADERARIVAMVRADAALWPDDSKTNGAMLYLADRIERGEP
jgi:hypothetical protein